MTVFSIESFGQTGQEQVPEVRSQVEQTVLDTKKAEGLSTGSTRSKIYSVESFGDSTPPTLANVNRDKDAPKRSLSNYIAQEIDTGIQTWKNLGAGTAKSFNLGMANFSNNLDKLSTFVAEKTGIPKGGIFESATAVYNQNADYWDKKLEDPTFTDEVMSEFLGGAIPGMTEFMLNAPYAAALGFTEEGTGGAIKEGARRILLGQILHAANSLNLAPRTASLATVGGVEAAAEGGDSREIAKSAGVMAGFGLIGGNRGKGLREVARDLRRTKPKTVAEAEEAPLHNLENSFEDLKDVWIGDKDVEAFVSDIDSSLMKSQLKKDYRVEKKATKEKLPYTNKQLDEAIQIHIDAKRNPGHIDKYFESLTPEQQKVVTLSQNLPDYALKTAEQIGRAYEKLGLEAKDADVITNTLDNYAARLWKRGEKTGAATKFGTTTGRAKQRKFETIIEGWANGKELAIKNATDNLNSVQKEISKVIADKQFIEDLSGIRDLEGNQLITTHPPKGKDYVRLKHPNITKWMFSDKLPNEVAADVSGQNFFTTPEGIIFERRSLYAPKSQAKSINNILGKSALNEIPTIREITKLNAQVKAWVLLTSLYHHRAFLNSFYLPGLSLKQFKQRPGQAIKYGKQLIEQKAPIIIHGVRNGLTLGVKQDYSAELLREKTIARNVISKVLKKTKATDVVRKKVGSLVDIINNLRDIQADYLFNTMGAGLKANMYETKFNEQVKKFPKEDKDVIAKRVARLVNDDFGGIHLGRIERNPTIQHLFKLAFLAPDWTESNVRTIVKTMKNQTGDVAEKTMYRKFWLGAAIKGLALTLASNYIMAGGDLDVMIKRYEEAWEAGNRNWMKTDITPIYKMFGGNSPNSKYFSLSGHFLDPVKWVSKPGQSVLGKRSILAGIIHEAITNTDWKGAQFTTFEELIDDGKLVQWGRNKKAINYEHFPSYLISQFIGTQPIQIQSLIQMSQGEIEPFDAVLGSIGMHISTTHKEKGRRKKRQDKRIKRLSK